MNLHDYTHIIINNSAGKDSLCAIYEICRMAKEQDYPLANIVLSHQDLKTMEWKGTRELAARQADHFGLAIYYSTRRTKAGQEQDLLEYVEQRGKWPSNKQRFCTSDFKRGPGKRVVTMLTKGQQTKVLYVFGFRAEESPARSKKIVLDASDKDKLNSKKRLVHEYLPIHDWSIGKVWQTIRENNLPYHPAYDLGMPRLSCCFCIFSPFDALVIAGKANPELLDRYIAVEQKIGHTFKKGFAIASVKEAIEDGYQPKKISDWIM